MGSGFDTDPQFEIISMPDKSKADDESTDNQAGAETGEVPEQEN